MLPLSSLTRIDRQWQLRSLFFVLVTFLVGNINIASSFIIQQPYHHQINHFGVLSRTTSLKVQNDYYFGADDDDDYDIDTPLYDDFGNRLDDGPHHPLPSESSSSSLPIIPPPATSSANFMRDEDDMLTEREDRLYIETAIKPEECILVAVEDLGQQRRSTLRRDVVRSEDEEVYFTLEESMSEMRELIKTAGLKLVGEVTQRMQEPNPKTYIGKGKVSEALSLAMEKGCCTIVFDAELHPGQQKTLENAFNKNITFQNQFGPQLLGDGEEATVKVIDRTALILDIFAQHAKTREGKLQVELALMEYRKPRLTRLWTHLERQSGAGGVGLRGPGESQLEIDKRLVRDRIIGLKNKIDDVSKQRDLHRKGRKKGGLPILSLVGYTNAGKSTLLNHLTRAGVMAENILFATLDPTTRKVKLPGYKTHPEVLLTDTVGFIQRLPTQLIAAFRATLEEVREADVLVHVVDVSSPRWEKEARSVNKVLKGMGIKDKPIVTVFNKIDLLEGRGESAEWMLEASRLDGFCVAISAKTGEGLEDFVAVVEEALSDLMVPIEVEIPFHKGDELNLIHEVGAVDTIDYRPTGTYIAASVPQAVAQRLEPYFVNELLDDDELSLQPSVVSNKEEDIDWVAIGRGRHSAKGQ